MRADSVARPPGPRPSSAVDLLRDVGQVSTVVCLSFLSCKMGVRQDSENSPQKTVLTPHPVCHFLECSGTPVRSKSLYGPSPENWACRVIIGQEMSPVTAQEVGCPPRIEQLRAI